MCLHLSAKHRVLTGRNKLPRELAAEKPHEMYEERYIDSYHEYFETR